MSAEFVTQIISTSQTVELAAEQSFYIPMTGPAARPRRSLKHDDTFVVLDSHGDIGASAGGPDGLFNADTRYLARLELVLDELQPLLLGSNLRDDNSALTVDLTNPDIYRQGRIVLQKDMLHIVRTLFLWRGTAYQRIGLQNHGDRLASFDLTLLFDNDFADLFEVRGEERPRRGTGSSKLLGPADVMLEYKGLDGEVRSSQRLLQAGPRAILQYPQLSLGRDGTLYAAWTTSCPEVYLYWDIHAMQSPDGGRVEVLGRYVITKIRTNGGISGLGESTVLPDWGGDHQRYFGESVGTTIHNASHGTIANGSVTIRDPIDGDGTGPIVTGDDFPPVDRTAKRALPSAVNVRALSQNPNPSPDRPTRSHGKSFNPSRCTL